jgi:hypothetical protein
MAKNCPQKKKGHPKSFKFKPKLGASGTHILSPRKLKFQTQKLMTQTSK